MTEDNPQQQEIDLNLVDFIKPIWRGRRFILAVFLITLAIVAIYNIFSFRIDKVEAVIKIGKINGNLIEKPAEIKLKIEEGIYNPETNVNPAGNLKASVLEEANLIVLQSETDKPQETKKFLEEVGNAIVADHQRKIDIVKDSLDKELTRNKNKLAQLQEEKKSLELSKKTFEQYAVYAGLNQQANVALLLLNSTRESLVEINGGIESLASSIDSFYLKQNDIQNTIIKGPSVSRVLTEQRMLLSAILGVILGMFLGIILVFAKTWWEKNKTEVKSIKD